MLRYEGKKIQKIRVIKAAKEISWITFDETCGSWRTCWGKILTNYLTPTIWRIIIGTFIDLLINMVFIVPIKWGHYFFIF